MSTNYDDNSDEPTEMMFCATAIMRAPPVRIARIGPNFTLPRTVALSTLLAGGGGALLAIAFVLPIAGAGIQQLLYSTLFGFGAGMFVINYSPLAGEPLLRWMGLSARHRRNRLEYAGRHVKVYVGAAQIGRVGDGEAHLVPSAVNVAGGAYDERGALRSARNRNLDDTPFTRATDITRAAQPTGEAALVLPVHEPVSDGRLGQWRQMNSQRTLDVRMGAFRALHEGPSDGGAHGTEPDSDSDTTDELDQER